MSKTNNPEIRINFSWLLMDDVSRKIAKLEDEKLGDSEKYEEWTTAYRKSWAEKEDKVLSAMQEITGLNFYLNVIDITTAPWVIAKSHPLILSFYDTAETVVDTITHELTHTLLCDNTILSIYGENRDFQLGTTWQKLFGFKDDFNALVHVPVHAINQIVFEKYLKDKDFVARDRKTMEDLGATSYLKSWDYVTEHGAENIVEKLKKSYAEIAKELEKKK